MYLKFLQWWKIYIIEKISNSCSRLWCIITTSLDIIPVVSNFQILKEVICISYATLMRTKMFEMRLYLNSDFERSYLYILCYTDENKKFETRQAKYKFWKNMILNGKDIFENYTLHRRSSDKVSKNMKYVIKCLYFKLVKVWDSKRNTSFRMWIL